MGDQLYDRDALRQLFDACDVEESGVISKKNLVDGLKRLHIDDITEEDANEIFAQLDTSKTGKVTFDAFAKRFTEWTLHQSGAQQQHSETNCNGENSRGNDRDVQRLAECYESDPSGVSMGEVLTSEWHWTNARVSAMLRRLNVRMTTEELRENIGSCLHDDELEMEALSDHDDTLQPVARRRSQRVATGRSPCLPRRVRPTLKHRESDLEKFEKALQGHNEVREMWEKLRESKPELLDPFANILGNISQQLQDAEAQRELLRSGLERETKELDRRAQVLDEEASEQIETARLLAKQEEQQRMEKIRSELIQQVEERDQKLEQALRNLQGLESKVAQLNQKGRKMESRFEELQQEKQTLKSELEAQQQIHDELRSQIDRSGQESPTRLRHSDSLESDQGELVHQLQTLRTMNIALKQKVQDRTDELLATEQEHRHLLSGTPGHGPLSSHQSAYESDRDWRKAFQGTSLGALNLQTAQPTSDGEVFRHHGLQAQCVQNQAKTHSTALLRGSQKSLPANSDALLMVYSKKKLEDEDSSVACAGMDESDSSSDDLRKKVPRRASHTSDLDSDLGRSGSQASTLAPSPPAAVRHTSVLSEEFTIIEPPEGQTQDHVNGVAADESPFLQKSSLQSASRSPQSVDRSKSPYRQGAWTGNATAMSAKTARRRGQYRRRTQRSPSPRHYDSTDKLNIMDGDQRQSSTSHNKDQGEDETDSKPKEGDSVCATSPQEKVIPRATVLPVQGSKSEGSGMTRSRSLRSGQRRSSKQAEPSSADKAWHRRTVAMRPRAQRQNSDNWSDEQEAPAGKPEQMPVVVHPMQSAAPKFSTMQRPVPRSLIQELGVAPERVFKVVFCGDSGVGKTSYIWRVCNEAADFTANFSSTIGVDFRTRLMTIEGHITVLQMWDTAGQERFRTLTKQYFRKADGVICIYDICNSKTFLSVRRWMDQIEEATEGSIAVMLIGNKIDLADAGPQPKRQVTYWQGQQQAQRAGALFAEVSAKSGKGVLETCEELGKVLYSAEKEVMEDLLTLEKRGNSPVKKKQSCCS